METINIHEAKTHFSKLIDAVAKGKEIIIARAGEPVARLTGIKSKKPVRRFGVFKGKMRIAEDFDASLPDDVIAAFEGR